MPDPNLKIDAIIYEPIENNDYGLKMACKRYTYTENDSRNEGITLLFLHGTGFHKECWEPIIYYLFKGSSDSNQKLRIREAWAVDWQSHGDSAVFNLENLKKVSGLFGASYWAAALASFMKSVYLTGHRINIISHSSGGTAALYTSKFLSKSHLPYYNIILVEPALVDEETSKTHPKERARDIKRLEGISKVLSKTTSTWKDKDAARKWLSQRMPYSAWDEEILGLYVKHALYHTTDSQGNHCVSLKCSRQHEVDGFTDVQNTYQATEAITDICNIVSLHLVFGGTNDLIPKYAQDSIINHSKGRHVSSVTTIPNVGHNVVQEKPLLLAGYLFELLRKSGDFGPASKL